jgi:hypothetical protein
MLMHWGSWLPHFFRFLKWHSSHKVVIFVLNFQILQCFGDEAHSFLGGLED